MITEIVTGVVAFVGLIYFISGCYVIRPNERAMVETLGKYSRMMNPGFNYVWAGFQNVIRVNVAEQMSDIEPQEIITADNLNAQVDLVVFYKLNETEADLKNAVYKVQNVEAQINTLARTTARNVIGTMDFKDVNGKRNQLNETIYSVLEKETKNWGIEITRIELKDITPPKDVQETMNSVIQAENKKTAALNLANAVETEADGAKRASIKRAEGERQAQILIAQANKESAVLQATGQAEAIKLVNEASHKYFVGNAQKLKQLEVTQASLQNNSKIVLTEKGMSPSIIIGNDNVVPTSKTK